MVIAQRRTAETDAAAAATGRTAGAAGRTAEAAVRVTERGGRTAGRRKTTTIIAGMVGEGEGNAAADLVTIVDTTSAGALGVEETSEKRESFFVFPTRRGKREIEHFVIFTHPERQGCKKYASVSEKKQKLDS